MQNQPNLDKWKFYLQNYCSPEQFIEWGFYSLVSAALQRRVYLGSSTMKLRPNMFVIFCAPPATGKGLVLQEVSNVLRSPKLLKVPYLADRKLDIETEMSIAPTNGSSHDIMNNMLIPIAPNATTYESLCNSLANCARAMYVETGKVSGDGKIEKRPEFHSSLYFLLEELASLSRRHTEDIHALLCEVFDCRDQYEYKTKHQGSDYIRRPCINFLAGTNPAFLRKVFSSELLDGGYASRTIFVVGMERRFRYYESPEHTSEQKQAFEEVKEHIAKVAKVCGEVKWSKEALEYNKHWYEEEYKHKVPNPHPKLAHYYGRINILHAKAAMAMHYGESLEPEIGLGVAMRTHTLMEKTEKQMHLAVGLETKNPLSVLTDEMFEYVINCPDGCTKKTLKTEFYSSFPGDPEKDISTIIQHLKDAGKIMDSPGGKANMYVRYKE